MFMYNCDFFVCFRTYLFGRALLAKILKLRRYRKAVRNLWSRFELNPSTVARVAGAPSFFFSGVDKTISRGFSKTLFDFHRAYDFFLFLRRDHDPATAEAVAVHRACNNRLQRCNATAPSNTAGNTISVTDLRCTAVSSCFGKHLRFITHRIYWYQAFRGCCCRCSASFGTKPRCM